MEGSDSVSLSPLPSAKEPEEELGKMAATEVKAVGGFGLLFWISSTNADGILGEKGVEGKMVLAEEDDAKEGLLPLYVEAMAALAMLWRAIPSVRVT